MKRLPNPIDYPDCAAPSVLLPYGLIIPGMVLVKAAE